MKKWPIVFTAALLAASPVIAGEGCTQVFGAPSSSFVSAGHREKVLPGPADWKQVSKVDKAFRKISPSGAPAYRCEADGCTISSDFKDEDTKVTFSENARNFLLVCTIESQPCFECESKTRLSPFVQLIWEEGNVSYGVQYTDNPDYDVDVDLGVDPKYDFLAARRKVSKLIRLEVDATVPRRR